MALSTGAKAVLLGGGVLAAWFLFTPRAGAEPNRDNVVPPGPRPRRPSNVPAGAGFARVTPHVLATDPDKWRNGLLVHKAPDSRSPLIAPEDASPTSLHANTGRAYGGQPDEVAVLELDVVDRSEPPTRRRWARVITPLGGRGYVSQVDPRDLVSNLVVLQPPSNVQPDVAAPPETPDYPPPADEFPPITMEQMVPRAIVGARTPYGPGFAPFAPARPMVPNGSPLQAIRRPTPVI